MIPYFLKLYLTNVRCFGPTQELDLTDGEGRPAQWTLILGDNGTGKTTILKSLAACYYRFIEDINYVDNPNLNFSSTLNFSEYFYFVRDATLEAKIEFQVVPRDWLDESTSKYYPLKSGITIFDHKGHVNEGISYNRDSGIFPPIVLSCFGYSAARIIDTSGITQDADTPGIASLFDEESKLMNAEEWLIQEDYRAAKNKDGKIEDKLKQVLDLLLDLFEGEIHDIRFESQKRPPHVLFQTDYGWVKLHELSLGYKTLIAWLVDFANRMFTLYEEHENPLAQPAIVLVDEIDLHMHPKFQRKLFHFLTHKFPNTQFIVTAHSPLIVQASQGANLAVLRKEGDHVVIENNPQNIKNWRVDQILTSDLFGLESARPPETEELLRERKGLLQKQARSEKEQIRLEQIEEEIEFMPATEDPDLNEAMDIIKRAAKEIKQQNS